jgi:RNA processing factor Prp31
MAVREPKDLLTMLADRGEEAIQRLSDAPGADRLLGAAQALRDRMDEMQKRIRGIDALEKRVAELEKRVEALSAPSTRSTTRKRTTSSKPRTRKPASGGNA